VRKITAALILFQLIGGTKQSNVIVKTPKMEVPIDNKTSV